MCIEVTPSLFNSSVKYATSPSAPGRGMTSRPPQLRMPKISPTDTSKLGDATCSTRSDPLTRYSARNQLKYSVSGRCVTVTPLGRPVEPEV